MRIGLFASVLYLLFSNSVLAKTVELWGLDNPDVVAKTSKGAIISASAFTARINRAALSERAGRALQVSLPNGAIQTLRISSLTKENTGGFYLNGTFENNAGRMSLYYGLNSIFGNIWINGKTYDIKGTAKDGSITISLADATQAVDLSDDAIRVPKSMLKKRRNTDGKSIKAAPTASTVDPTLDYLWLYNSEIIDNFGWGVVDFAASNMSFLNSTFAESDVPLKASMADMLFMNPDPAFTTAQILFAISGEEGEFAGILAAQSRLGADIISASAARGAGIGFVNDPTSSDIRMIHVNGNLNSMTVAHETGHNLGLGHDVFGNGLNRRTVDSNCGVVECWARGYTLRDPLSGEIIYQSIMNPNGNGLVHSGSIPSFSNPDINCKKRRDCPRGIPMEGIAGRPNSGADAALALRTYVAEGMGGGHSTAGVPNQRMLSALLPTSRFVTTGEVVTAFMTVFNPNTILAEECKIQHHGPDRDSFTFQATDPATNAPVGVANTPVDIPAGTFQTFVISITPSADLSGIVFAPFASCANAPMAAVTQGLNTVILGADSTNGPDLIALSATLNNNGIVDVPDSGFGVFSVATINIGGAGNALVSARSLAPSLPATALVCQTDSTGACMQNPSQSVSLLIEANGAPTFGVFVQTAFPTSFAPGKRFQFEMKVNGALRGATTVALRDQAPLTAPAMADQAFSLNATKGHSGALADQVSGFATSFEIVAPPGHGTIKIDPLTGLFTYTAGMSTGIDSFTYRALNPGGVSNTAIASITTNALPLPTARSASFEDDVDGLFQVDLDTLANGDIDQFVLQSAPTGTVLDPVSGFLEVPLPGSPGQVKVQFAAKNISGQSSAGSITINAVAFDSCMPLRATKFRILRRLTAIPTDDSGLVNIDEGLALLDSMCLPPPDQLAATFAGSYDSARQLFFAFDLDPFTNGWDIERYSIRIQTSETLPDDVAFQLCKQAGDTMFFECPLK